VSPASVSKGGTATFTISASASAAETMDVSYSMSGTAVIGSDYALAGQGNKITIPSGQSSGSVTLNVITGKTKGKEKATMTLNAGHGYKLPAGRRGRPAKPPKATVTILNK
jgi:large repetitive protein